MASSDLLYEVIGAKEPRTAKKRLLTTKGAYAAWLEEEADDEAGDADEVAVEAEAEPAPTTMVGSSLAVIDDAPPQEPEREGTADAERTRVLGVLKARGRSDGTMEGAFRAALFYARKHDKPCYVFPGNSYMHEVWQAVFRRSDARNRINNSSGVVFIIYPDGEVRRADREGTAG